MNYRDCHCLLFTTMVLLLSACSSQDVKDKINQAGDVTGQTIGEFAEGINSGVDKAFELQVEPAPTLIASGVSIGKVSLCDSSGISNVLTVYLIFDKDFNGDITARVFDNKQAEMGRAKVPVNAKKSEAGFYDFRFDPRTRIDADSKVQLN